MVSIRSSVRRRVAVLAVGLLAFLVMSPGTAAAHSGNALFETLQVKGGSDLVIHLRPRVRFDGDRELAERAFVKVTPRAPDGRTLPTVDLERGAGGVYGGAITVDRPGTWTLAVSSAFPPGSTTLRVDVGKHDSSSRWLVIIGIAGTLAALGLVIVVVRRRQT